jgi:hypothetical protein
MMAFQIHIVNSCHNKLLVVSKRRKKKGGSDVNLFGDSGMLFNTNSLVTNDHSPMSVISSPDVTALQYAPSAFSAGISTNPILDDGVPNPYRELMSQQIIGS